jgi:eukaryotic-like serine/threonine-protein kinase
LIGRTISHYKVLDKLGEGGMGVVYRAEDTKLHRVVALKFLRPDAVGSRELKARFLTEAEAAAALIHPNICVVHEIDEANDQSFIAMEYVEGESLAEKIKKRPLPLEEALHIASQLAEGLQAAHEKGIVHRDIKPANIMLDAAGRAKVMDFGLAHLEEATRITKSGTSIGTPAYMSPEQVRGEKADHRTDIWSVGVVIYEMVAGRLPFPGDVPEAISHAVVHESPEPLTALRAGVPIELDWIAGKCLAKEPKQRYQHADELMVDLKTLSRKLESGSAAAVTTPLPTPTPISEKRRRSYAVPILAVLLVLSLIMTAIAWLRPPERETPIRRFAFSPGLDAFTPAISPDGRHIAYITAASLWVLDLQTGEPRVIEGTVGAEQPFWSPDGQRIAFALDTDIWQVSLAGGRPLRLFERHQSSFTGGSFSAMGDSIVYTTFGGGLHLESVAGMDLPSRYLDPSGLETGGKDYAPHFLPIEGGREVLLYVEAGSDEGRILVRDLDSGETTSVGSGWFPVFSSNGYILYQTSQSVPGIWAVPFSVESLKVTGEAFSVAERGERPSVARDGTLVYLDTGSSGLEQLVWRGRSGNNIDVIGQPQQNIGSIALSPDEDRVAVTGSEGGNDDIWIHEVDRRVKTRLTSDPRREVQPEWSPAGDQIGFTSVGQGSFLVATDRSIEPQALLGVEAGWLDDWSPDGKSILLGTGQALSYVELDSEDGDREPVQVLPFWARDATFSPDGRFIAYISIESERSEVYVCEFPSGGNRTQVSTEGGLYPKWGRDGKELFYVDGGVLTAVPVTTSTEFRITGDADKLFPVDGVGYDIAADGQRFVVVEPVGGEAVRPVIRVVQNWFAEFRDRQ